jgi:hypothetical protein
MKLIRLIKMCLNETLIDASKEVGLDINVEKTKYMLLSHHQNAVQVWNIKHEKDNLKIYHSWSIWRLQ